jgi:serine/threonine protein kinase
MRVLEDPGGEPLGRLIQGPMELGEFLRLAVGLAGALRELHTRQLIHKDVKPANVLADARTGHVRLMGFGIATRLRRERQSLEPPEFIAGTLAYMAPEQTGRMNRSIDSRSDLYACGVTFYEMLTGSLPFTASEPMEDSLSHRAPAAAAGRAGERDPENRGRDRHEAARQERRGPLPDRRGPGGRSEAMSRRLGNAGQNRSIPLGRAGCPGSTPDPGAPVRP